MAHKYFWHQVNLQKAKYYSYQLYLTYNYRQPFSLPYSPGNADPLLPCLVTPLFNYLYMKLVARDGPSPE